MLESRDRRASDMTSGLELKRENFPTFSDDDISRNFELFKAYDLDNSGFITPENMFDVLKALDMEVTMESTNGMIEEVATLTGHDNDGKLSFRDFMNMTFHDQQAAESMSGEREAENTAAAASREIDVPDSPVGALTPAFETQTQQSETQFTPESEPEVAPASPGGEQRTNTCDVVAEPALQTPPPLAKRRSSMSILNAVAADRIKAFQQVATDAVEREKLHKFKKAPVEMTGPMVNSDNMHLQTLQSKLKAFEIAAHHKGKTEVRKTWKKVGGAGNYQSGNKILLGGQPVGVAPKKKISDLP